MGKQNQKGNQSSQQRQQTNKTNQQTGSTKQNGQQAGQNKREDLPNATRTKQNAQDEFDDDVRGTHMSKQGHQNKSKGI